LDCLVENLSASRVLLLVDYRPEYQHGWGAKPYYTQLRLESLALQSTKELLDSLLGDDSGLLGLKQLLTERTEGNPFFLEETVRTLIETQVLVGDRGAYRLMKDVTRIQVAPTIQAVLAARIDRLPVIPKQLLQCAAVVGRDVSFALLEAIAELPEAELHSGLAQLQASEFLHPAGLFPDPEYTFKHALTHEVAYGSILRPRRRHLHARIAEALERLGIRARARGQDLHRHVTVELEVTGSEHGAEAAAADRLVEPVAAAEHRAGDRLSGPRGQVAVGKGTSDVMRLGLELSDISSTAPFRPFIDHVVY